MTLILSNAEIARIVTMQECIDVLEEAFIELAESRAAIRHRSDICTPSGHDSGGMYVLKSMDGVVPKLGVGAIRINSEIRTYPEVGGFKRIVKLPAPSQRYTGLVLLFSTTTGEPLAIIPDGEIQPMRVAATSAIGAKMLAREDAKVVAILGSGWQARSQVRAIAKVRQLTEIRCYSTKPELREAFAAEMSPRVGVNITAVSSVEEAVGGADIVLAATNSYQSVIRPEHVEAGMHLSTITTGEFSPEVIARADVSATLVEESEPAVITTEGIQLPEGSQGTMKSATPESSKRPLTLLDLLIHSRKSERKSDKIIGRTSPSQITCFVNLLGLGVQFAAVGALVYRKAKELGIGRELPTDWFTQIEMP